VSSKSIINTLVILSLLALSAVYIFFPNYKTVPRLIVTEAISRALQNPAIAPRKNPDGTTDYALISWPILGFPGRYWILRLPSDTYTYRSEDTMSKYFQQLAKGEKFKPSHAEPNEYINFELSIPELKPVTIEQYLVDPYSQHTLHLRLQNALGFMEKRNEEDPAYLACKVVRQVAPGIIELKPNQPPSKKERIEKGCYVPNAPEQYYTGYRITNDKGEFIMALNCAGATVNHPHTTCGWDLDLDNIRGIGIDFSLEEVPPEKLREFIQRLIALLKTANVDSGQFAEGSKFSFKN
jgi:hypothetical protein